jgi:hypothetical protein
MVGAGVVASSKPDGHTLLMRFNQHSQQRPNVFPNWSHHPIHRLPVPPSPAGIGQIPCAVRVVDSVFDEDGLSYGKTEQRSQCEAAWIEALHGDNCKAVRASPRMARASSIACGKSASA